MILETSTALLWGRFCYIWIPPSVDPIEDTGHFFRSLIHLIYSGHACSVTGPLIFLIYFTGWKTLLPCLVVGAGSNLVL